MSYSPFELSGSLQIGTVDFVSPNKIEVLLIGEAPESITLSAGAPRPFPRVSDYLLIPVDERYIVGQVEWITIEQSPFPDSRGLRNTGFVDLPYPRRKLRLNPLGTLRAQATSGQYVFQRGADALPSVGAAVMLPTEGQLRSVVEIGSKHRGVTIGVNSLAGNAKVSIDPNRLFGRHLAVLGNTGSGKSCSVAGLIRWSIEEAQKACSHQPNARFIILDPNGEYSRAFRDDEGIKARIFAVDEEDHASNYSALKVPLWFWNSTEWCSFTQASARTQRPTLIHALRFVRDGQIEPAEDTGHEMRRYLRTIVTIIRIEKNSGSPWGRFPQPKSFYEKIEKWKSSLQHEVIAFEGEQRESLQSLIGKMEELCSPRSVQYPHYDFTLQEVQELFTEASKAHSAFGGTPSDIFPVDVDAPRSFDKTSFLRGVEAAAEMLNVSEHVETLLVRIRALLTDSRMKPIIGNASDISLQEWLSNYIGNFSASNGCVSVIDLSLVPSDVVHIITAVIARMTFEALQRYVKLNGTTLPTVLVMEEAHTYIKRYREDTELHNAEAACCQAFERIAREGRKFGLGLVLSSQRPSELSPTVLSQCNTFLLHRLTNDRDQDMVHRLVADNLKGLLHELPSLPTQTAILLGWATELPVLVRMNDLPTGQQPRSDDPEFWEVWTGRQKRTVDWGAIADDWQGKQKDGEGEDTCLTSDDDSDLSSDLGRNGEDEIDIAF